jgi:hypothetical protein
MALLVLAAYAVVMFYLTAVKSIKIFFSMTKITAVKISELVKLCKTHIITELSCNWSWQVLQTLLIFAIGAPHGASLWLPFWHACYI